MKLVPRHPGDPERLPKEIILKRAADLGGWIFLDVCGGYRGSVGSSGCLWKFVEVFGSLWGFLRVSGAYLVSWFGFYEFC